MDKDQKIEPKVIQTYAEDMAKVLEKNEGGIIKKIIHGEEEHEAERRNISPGSKKNKIFIFAGLVFIFLGLSVLFFFVLTKKNDSVVSIQKQFTPIIFNDKSAFFEVKGFSADQVEQTVANEAGNTAVKTGGVEGIYLTEDKAIIGLREFLKLIGANFAPGNTNFVDDNFLIGVVNDSLPAGGGVPASRDFFILIKTRTISDIFDSLRAWENKMFLDLHSFFGVYISTDTNYLSTKNFEDGVIQNKNARILYDNNHNIVLMYVFADDNSVIISNTENATREIMLRLAGSQVGK